MDDKDLAQVQDMIKGSITAALSAYDARNRAAAPPSTRSSAEVGSPEFAEDRTQINSLNNKWVFAKEVFSEDTLRREEQQLFGVAMQSLTESVNLSKQLHSKFFERGDDRAEVTRGWNYAMMYDVSNPTSLGVADNVRGGMVPQNRAIDTAAVQSVVNSNTFQAAIQAAVSDALTGTIPTLEASIGAAVAAALVNTPVKPTASPAVS